MSDTERDQTLKQLTELLEKMTRQREEEDADERRNSVGSISWSEAPIPSRFHRCYPHTTGWVGFDQVQRCACGAIRNIRFRGWLEKNSRRKAA